MLPAIGPCGAQAAALYRISATGKGLHRKDLDEDNSVEGLLVERGDMTVQHPDAA